MDVESLDDRTKFVLRTIDDEVGLDIFFEAACKYSFDDEEQSEEAVLDVLAGSERPVDELINWNKATIHDCYPSEGGWHDADDIIRDSIEDYDAMHAHADDHIPF